MPSPFGNRGRRALSRSRRRLVNAALARRLHWCCGHICGEAGTSANRSAEFEFFRPTVACAPRAVPDFARAFFSLEPRSSGRNDGTRFFFDLVVARCRLNSPSCAGAERAAPHCSRSVAACMQEGRTSRTRRHGMPLPHSRRLLRYCSHEHTEAIGNAFLGSARKDRRWHTRVRQQRPHERFPRIPRKGPENDVNENG